MWSMMAIMSRNFYRRSGTEASVSARSQCRSSARSPRSLHASEYVSNTVSLGLRRTLVLERAAREVAKDGILCFLDGQCKCALKLSIR